MQSQSIFTIYRITFAPARKPYQTGLLFTHKNCGFGAILLRNEFKSVSVLYESTNKQNSNFAQARLFAIALVENLLIGQVAPAKKRANVEATLCGIAYHIDMKNTLTCGEHITMPPRVFPLSGSAKRIFAPFQKALGG